MSLVAAAAAAGSAKVTLKHMRYVTPVMTGGAPLLAGASTIESTTSSPYTHETASPCPCVCAGGEAAGLAGGVTGDGAAGGGSHAGVTSTHETGQELTRSATRSGVETGG
jgi:hypothetical protein